MSNFVSHREEVISELRDKEMLAMEECGIVAEGHAVKNLRDKKAWDTGNLAGSVDHLAFEAYGHTMMAVGTNVEYGIYIEHGTGKYYPGGRKSPWGYEDAKGNFHWTSGMPAREFIKPSIADHKKEYKNIIESKLK